MVLSLEQCAFIMKWYYETHSLKHVCIHFIQEFPNSVSPFNRITPNLIFLNSKMSIMLDDLPCLGSLSVMTLEKKEGDCKECHETIHHIVMITGAAGKAFTQINIPYTSLPSQSIQNFYSTQVKVSLFSRKSRVSSMALLLHTWWCFDV